MVTHIAIVAYAAELSRASRLPLKTVAKLTECTLPRSPRFRETGMGVVRGSAPITFPEHAPPHLSCPAQPGTSHCPSVGTPCLQRHNEKGHLPPCSRHTFRRGAVYLRSPPGGAAGSD
jgi:hypothetical protein